MVHDLFKIVLFESSENIEEIFPWWPLPKWIIVWEVDIERGIFGKLWPKVFHRQLVVAGNFDFDHLILFEQHLFATKDILEKVLIDMSMIGKVVLDCKIC